MRRASAWLPAILPLVCLIAFGCGGAKDAPKTVPAAGVVTYNGQPVANASLVFSPVGEGDLRPGMASTGTDGAFEARTSQSAPGLMPGNYKVVVQAFKRNPVDIPPPEIKQLGDSNLAVPKKYTNEKTTDATVTVAAGGSKDLKIELKD